MNDEFGILEVSKDGAESNLSSLKRVGSALFVLFYHKLESEIRHILEFLWFGILYTFVFVVLSLPITKLAYQIESGVLNSIYYDFGLLGITEL